jgi:hypothetical protein
MGVKLTVVIAGLDPAIHPSSLRLLAKGMDARVKPAHDAFNKLSNSARPLSRGRTDITRVNWLQTPACPTMPAKI